MNQQVPVTAPPDDEAAAVSFFAQLLCSMFVRNEQRFYHVDNPYAPLSKRDMEQAFLNIVSSMSARALDPSREFKLTNSVFRKVIDIAVERKHTDRTRSIAVWGKTMACHPGNRNRIIWLDTGVVTLNTWKEPAYRSVKPDTQEGVLQPFKDYFSWVFPRPQERMMVLNWLSWCLQYESKKPTWALLLYSRQKGTGKSTFCEIARKLFGDENTATQAQDPLICLRPLGLRDSISRTDGGDHEQPFLADRRAD